MNKRNLKRVMNQDSDDWDVKEIRHSCEIGAINQNMYNRDHMLK